MSAAVKRRDLGAAVLLGGPVLLCALAIVVPLVLTLIISFWERQMIGMRPGFSLASYALFFEGARFSVLQRSFWVATSSTLLMLAIRLPRCVSRSPSSFRRAGHGSFSFFSPSRFL